MEELTLDQKFVEFIAKNLVDNESDVRVDRVVDERGVLLTLYVHPDDLGRVIGKRGAIAESIRTILRSLGIKHGAHYNLKIADTDGGASSRPVVQDEEPSQYARPAETVEEESDFIKNTRQELADLED